MSDKQECCRRETGERARNQPEGAARINQRIAVVNQMNPNIANLKHEHLQLQIQTA
jgi:hypothetical protein